MTYLDPKPPLISKPTFRVSFAIGLLRAGTVDGKLKHLEFIQGVVNRLSTNSFLLKGWSVVLVASLFALSAANANRDFAALAFVPALVFWGLDGFFLRQEKLFRKLYDNVRSLKDAEVDFAMNTASVDSEVSNWLRCAFTKTLWPFHGALIAAVALVFCIQG